MVEISVSLLSKPEEMKIEQLAAKIKELEKSGAASIHWDVMDGKYNSNNTWDYLGPDIIKKLRPITSLPFMAHLMISDPKEKIKLFAESCESIIFHQEACQNPGEVISEIKSQGRKAGIAIEPDTPVEVLTPYLSEIDYVLVLTVKTGYAGQSFIDKKEEIQFLDQFRKNHFLKFKIAVDGGINDVTGKYCREAGADILCVASYILNSKDYKTAINSLK